MTPQESGQLVAAMQGTWASFPRDDVGVELWMQDLEPLDLALAHETFRALRASLDFAPSWAKYIEAYRATKLYKPGLLALEEPVGPLVPAEKVEALFAEVREKLDANAPSKGWTPLREATGDPLEPMLTYAEVYEEPPAEDPTQPPEE